MENNQPNTMKVIKNIVGIGIGLFILYLIAGFVWGVLNMQSCTSNLPKNPTCEQIAENNANNCKYVILKWKKVDYDKELKECREWEQKQEK